MKLTTPVTIVPFKKQIDEQSSVLMLGSCFTNNIGSKLQHCGVEVVINPYGIIFNPHSIAVLIDHAVNDKAFTDRECVDSFSFLAHSTIHDKNRSSLIDKLNAARKSLKSSISKATHVFITLGTGWVYRHKELDTIVTNCHQQPQNLFIKELLSITAIEKNLQQIYDQIKSINSSASITFTVSPVRHLKNGAVENMLSKSHLISAIHAHIAANVALYFPAYEIVMDELRDYRFYASDMLHLNDTGIEYVWLRFRESVIKSSLTPQMNALKKYYTFKNHRSTNADLHHQQVLTKKETLASQYPNIHWYE